MDGYKRYEITNASFEEFVNFLFDQQVVPIPDDAKLPGPWYYNAEVTYDPIRVASQYIQLFTQPEFLLAQFSRAQLEQGFWEIQSPNLECGVCAIIWNETVKFDIRQSCVRSMFHLFERLFFNEPLDTAVEMWWDSLAYDWHCGNRSRTSGGEDESMQDVMFETLSRILKLDSPTCQGAALHGLGHLHHPDTEQLIRRYIERNKNIDPALREYALAAARFNVL